MDKILWVWWNEWKQPLIFALAVISSVVQANSIKRLIWSMVFRLDLYVSFSKFSYSKLELINKKFLLRDELIKALQVMKSDHAGFWLTYTARDKVKAVLLYEYSDNHVKNVRRYRRAVDMSEENKGIYQTLLQGEACIFKIKDGFFKSSIMMPFLKNGKLMFVLSVSYNHDVEGDFKSGIMNPQIEQTKRFLSRINSFMEFN